MKFLKQFSAAVLLGLSLCGCGWGANCTVPDE